MNELTLNNLATEINEQHHLAEQTAHQALEYARKAGELLLKAKTEVAHGQWLPWIDANLHIGNRQAQKYMKLANNWDVISKTNSDSHLTIDTALKSISKSNLISIEGGKSLKDFGILGLDEKTQLMTTLLNGSLVLITPSSRHRDFYFIEMFDWGGEFFSGWRRPVCADAVPACLDVMGIKEKSMWHWVDKTANEPVLMKPDSGDCDCQRCVDMGLMPESDGSMPIGKSIQ